MLKNFWYACEFSAAVTTQTPTPVRVLGQDLVLFRRPDGTVAALSSHCIHRGGALADGQIDGACVRCPYHGWKFDGAGHCVEIPALSPDQAIPKRARVDAYPTEEHYGLVWVFLGDLPPAERPPIPPFPEFSQPGWKALYGEFVWDAHYTRVVENGVDIAHAPFVHRRSFGNPEQPQVPPHTLTSTQYSLSTSVTLQSPSPRGLWKLIRPKRSSVEVSVEIHLPHITRLDLRLGRGWRNVVFDANVPVDAHTTRTLWVQLRNFFRGDWADGDARRRMDEIFCEDQPIVEAQTPKRVPDDLADELHIKSDSMAVAYRTLRRGFLQRGFGLDTEDLAQKRANGKIHVIGSPPRRDPDIPASSWVYPEAPSTKPPA